MEEEKVEAVSVLNLPKARGVKERSEKEQENYENTVTALLSVGGNNYGTKQQKRTVY